MISSTNEISDFISTLPEEKKLQYTAKMTLIRKLLDMPGISQDLLIRIVGAELWLQKPITLEMLNDWRKDANFAYSHGRIKHLWIAVANNTKKFYNALGVKWTKCRPDNIAKIEKEINKINKLESTKIKGLPVIELITGCKTMEEYSEKCQNAKKPT